MTTADRPDINADVERRLRSWMTSSSTPDLSDLYEGVASSTRGAPQRRRLLVPGRNRRSTVARERVLAGRRLGIAFVTAVALTVALVAGLLLGARLLRNHGPLPGVFRSTGDIPLPAEGFIRPAIAVLPDGRVLFAGAGQSLLAGVLFDPATETYGKPIFETALRRGATATTLQNGLVLLTGGEFGQSDAASFTTVLFDPASESFATTNPLVVARSDHTATLLDDGRVLIAGGRHYPKNGSPALNEYVVALDSVEIYDPSTGMFTETAPMHVARAGQTATALRDGRVLIAGGYATSPGGGRSMATQAEILDPTTGTFRLIGSMVAPRGHHTATLLGDGRVLLVGGADRYGPRGEQLGYTATAEVFDPATDTFTAVQSLVTERAGHSATLLPDARVLIVGGTNERGGPRTTEVFDSDIGGFVPGPKAVVEHHVGVAPLLADGRVLVAGSGAGGSETFDPTANGGATAVATPGPSGARAFTPVTTLVMRHGPTTIVLRDGRVLIAGGDPGTGERSVTGLEILDPATGLTSVGGTLPGWLAQPLTSLPDGRVLFITYTDDSGNVASLYDPASGTFTPARDLTRILRDGNLVGVSGPDDGRLIMINDASAIFAVDPSTGRSGRPIPACPSVMGIVQLEDGRLLIPCGTDYDAVILDLAAGTTEGTGLRFDQGIPLGDGRIALITPIYGASGDPTRRVIGVYDPEARTLAPAAAELPLGTLVAVEEGVFVFGGPYGAPSDRTLLLDTTTWLPRDLGPMLARRSDPTAAVLSDGRILLVGGAPVSPDRTDPVPSGAELFDPSLVP